MYTPSHFKMDDEQTLFSLIEANAFGLLLSPSCLGEVQCSHLPFYLDRKDKCLIFHLAKNNPHCDSIEDNSNHKVVFQGPHGYISPSWIIEPSVPTWNYTAVHVLGAVSEITDEREKLEQMKLLTVKYENINDSNWSLDSLPENRVFAMFKGIRMYRLSFETITGKFKLSQNKSEESRNCISAKLQKLGNTELGEMMANEMEPK